MSKLKKAICLFVAALMVFTLVQIPNLVKAEGESTPVYVKIRYTREDGNYDGWNLWVWGPNVDAHEVEFTNEDSQGKYVVLETTKEAGSLNYIIRTKDWDKFLPDNQVVDVSDGRSRELVSDEATKTVTDKDVQTDFDTVNITAHYYRFDGDYTNWDIWSWGGDSTNNQFSFTSEDDFGKVGTISHNNVTAENKVGVIIRKNDWSQKDPDGDRFFNLIYADCDGNMDAYFVQGDSNIYYTIDSANIAKDPKISQAKMDTLTTINFKTTTAITDEQFATAKLTDSNGNEVSIADSSLISSNAGQIITATDLDLNQIYTLSINGFKPCIVTLGKNYDSEDFANAFQYDGDLGALYSSDSTEFVLWAPTATDVKLVTYETGNDSNVKETFDMNKGENGTWFFSYEGNHDGLYYNYLVTVGGVTNEVTDPYAKAVGLNGDRGMVINLASTDPTGFGVEKKPELASPTDAIVYEMHIRDLTHSLSSGVINYKGKFNGVWQSGTTIPGTDVKTGIDHLKELGVNVVQIMPSYDFCETSVDEANPEAKYNWGYDPKNYNVPEGSYSSDPYHGEIRVKEFKQMIQELHKAGIRVVMDVVYNHTGKTTDSNLNLAVPNYYYRQNENGGFSNGSGCGNEVASDRSMVRKFIVDSVKYWASEYHMDGFRFDLMGLLDQDTLREVRTALDAIDPSILIYGEGWTGGTSALAPDKQCSKADTYEFGNMQIGAFSDDIRDGIKGHVFTDDACAFVNGADGFEDKIKFGVVASTIDVGENKAWAAQPYQTITYASCHDNPTLWDRLQVTRPDASEEELLAMNKLSAAIILTSQGIPFFLQGEEFARTKELTQPDPNTANDKIITAANGKQFVGDSYKSSDFINEVDWNRKVTYKDLNAYYQGLITMRTNHKAFKMNTTDDIKANLSFIDNVDKNVVAYTINGAGVKDSWKNIAVIFNANTTETKVTLPSNDWVVVVDQNKAGVDALATVEGNVVTVPAQASYVLVDKASYEAKGDDDDNKDDDNKDDDNKDNKDDKDDQNKDDQSGNSEKTADINQTRLIIGLAILSMATILALVVRKKRSTK